MSRNFNYTSAAMLLFALSNSLLILAEYDRVFPEHRSSYVLFRLAFALISVALAVWSYLKKPADLVAASVMILCIFYSVTFMWFGALYELAYIQCAIGCTFLPVKRRWLYPVIFIFGFFGIASTYYLQEHLKWKVPSYEKIDLIWSIGITFILCILIQKLALRSRALENIFNMRLIQIGKESSRIIHDVKGMISLPRFRIEKILKSKNLLDEEVLTDLQDLEEELSGIATRLKRMNRLIQEHSEKVMISPINTITETAEILKIKMSNIELVRGLSLENEINVDIDRLRSIMFNLFLNSISAFEQNQIPNRKIIITLVEQTLIYEDNAGGITKNDNSSGEGTGLGLDLIEYDVSAMDGNLKIKRVSTGTRFEIQFASN